MSVMNDTDRLYRGLSVMTNDDITNDSSCHLTRPETIILFKNYGKRLERTSLKVEKEKKKKDVAIWMGLK